MKMLLGAVPVLAGPGRFRRTPDAPRTGVQALEYRFPVVLHRNAGSSSIAAPRRDAILVSSQLCPEGRPATIGIQRCNVPRRTKLSMSPLGDGTTSQASSGIHERRRVDELWPLLVCCKTTTTHPPSPSKAKPPAVTFQAGRSSRISNLTNSTAPMSLPARPPSIVHRSYCGSGF